jgi:hypothetical protein
MKRLFSANTSAAEATLEALKSAIEGEGINCVVQNDLLSFATDQGLELWVVDDQNYSRAKEIVDSWEGSVAEPHASWVCAHCRETMEGQFTSCWKCGREREDA